VALWHSRLPKVDKSNMTRTRHLWCVGAEHGGKWYAVAIWTNPISPTYAHKPFLELRRMAISDDAPKNTASRMLGIMARMIRKRYPAVTNLISYQDTDVHTGTIYAAAGWRPEGFRKGGEDIWTTNNRRRAKQQAAGDKIRWERKIA
jgi:hypothetical protein